mgnify:CR=1 FL=1
MHRKHGEHGSNALVALDVILGGVPPVVVDEGVAPLHDLLLKP